MNFASTQNPDKYTKQEILRYVTIAISVFCEYLCAQTERVQRAAASAIRIIIQNGLTSAHFVTDSKKDDITAILSLDAMTISEEVENIRNDRRSKQKFTAQDKLMINICYLLSTRFEDQYEMVLKIISTFVLKLGGHIAEK